MTQRKKLSEFAELELELPKIDLPSPELDISSGELQHDTHDMNADDEGAMVKADLYKLAKYSVKLFKKIEDEDQFESWVQAKITKAADYISSVYHYLEYEMKFSEYGDKIENSDMYSESQKRQMKNALMEAKKTLAALKIDQADKLDKTKTVKEGVSHTCGECGGTGMVEKALPEKTKTLVNKHRILRNFVQSKIDSDGDSIPDDEELPGHKFTPDVAPGKSKSKKSSPFEKKNDDEKDDVTSKKPAKKSSPFDKKDDSEKDDSKKDDSNGSNPFAKKSAPKKDSGDDSKSKKSAPKKEKDDSKTEGIFGGSVYGESVTPVKKPSSVADKKSNNPFAKKDDKKDGGKEFGKALEKARADINESSKKAKKDYDKDGKIETGEEEHKGAVDNAIKASKEKDCKNESAEFNAIMRNSGLNEFKDDMGYDISPEEYAAQEKQNAQWAPSSQEPMPKGGKALTPAQLKAAAITHPFVFGPESDKRMNAMLQKLDDQANKRDDEDHARWSKQLDQSAARWQQQLDTKYAADQAADQDAAAKRAYYSTHPDELANTISAQQQGQDMMNNPQIAVDRAQAARTQADHQRYLDQQNQGWFQESTELDRLKMITERVIK